MNHELLKKIIVAAGTLLFCGSLLLMYFLAIVPHDETGKIKLSLEIAYRDKAFVYENIVTEKDSVLDMLEEYNEELSLLFVRDDGSENVRIGELKGTPVNAADGCVYALGINGERKNGAIDTVKVTDGDVIRIEYGSFVYKENGEILRFDLRESAQGSTDGERLFLRSTSQIVIIVVCTIAAALSLVLVLFGVLKKKRNTDDYDFYV